MDGLDVTRNIAAGMAMAVGGIVPPHLRYSSPHGGVLNNWLWSVGHHPFGPYSNTAGVRWPPPQLDSALS